MNKKEQQKWLDEAKKRGFKSGSYFISATGISDCLILGELEIKYTSNKSDENYEFNGDIVSTGGYGLIYDASTNTWGVLLNQILIGSGITGINARKVTNRNTK